MINLLIGFGNYVNDGVGSNPIVISEMMTVNILCENYDELTFIGRKRA